MGKERATKAEKREQGKSRNNEICRKRTIYERLDDERLLKAREAE